MSLQRMHSEIAVDNKADFTFKKRLCDRFTLMKDKDGNPLNICKGCKNVKEKHYKNLPISEKWDIECTSAENTDAFGEIKFSSSFTNKAKYIRIANDTKESAFLKFMHEKWSLESPKLIISITGGAQDFNIDDNTKKVFKMGLIKAAKTTNAWIVTGGTHFGCMRLAGDAVMEDLNSQLPLIGIATWGVVSFRENLIRRQQNEDETNRLDDKDFFEVEYYPEKDEIKSAVADLKNVPINPNHTHFILVDDGSNAEFGVEIDFRTRLENAIRTENGANIPMVVIVLEGGIGTLETAYGALYNKVPVILVEGTGQCADLILEARKEKVKVENEERIKELIGERIKQKLEGEKLEKAVKYLKEFLKNENQIYINAMQKNCTDFEPVILDALSRINTDFLKKCILGIKWNQYEIVKSSIEEKKEDFKSQQKIANDDKSEDKIAEIKAKIASFLNELLELLEVALIENKPNIVELLLRYGVNFKEYFTKSKLGTLYASVKKSKTEEPFKKFLKKHNIPHNPADFDSTFTISNVDKFMKHLFYKASTFFLPVKGDPDENINEPELNLFLWAIIAHRVEIAKLFWRLGKNQIANALIASKIYRYFSRYESDVRDELRDNAEKFEDLAIKVLNVFDVNHRDVVNDVLILRYIAYLKMDCLELAVHCACKRFVSRPIVQNVIKSIWTGDELCSDSLELNVTELDLKNSQIKCNANKEYALHRHASNYYQNLPENYKIFKKFISVPKYRFIANLIFYIFFLGLFSYTMIYEFSPVSDSGERASLKNGNSIRLFGFKSVEAPIKPKAYEFILLIWILGLAVEEFLQFYKDKNFLKNWKRYKRNEWNILDILGCVLYILGFILKMIATNSNQGVFVASKIILSIDLSIWYLRALHFCLASSKLGPKLLMIRRMMNDLLYFFVVITNFVFAFGVAVQAIIFPQEKFSLKIILSIFNIAYWPIYGEIKVLDYLDECSESETCDSASIIVSFLLIMFYMALSSILLINILIAMFSSTFEGIQTKSATIWKNQRYDLICEYIEYLPLPPPLNIFFHLGRWIYNRHYAPEVNKYEVKPVIIILNDALTDYEQRCTEKLLREMIEPKQEK